MSLDFNIYRNCPCCHADERVFERNITGNLVPMWKAVSVYDALYNSDGLEPNEIKETILKGIHELVSREKEMRELEPDNGWGTYESALKLLEDVHIACIKYCYHTIIRIYR
jgi:hypothetical protein